MTRSSSLNIARVLFESSCKHQTGELRLSIGGRTSCLEFRKGYISAVSNELFGLSMDELVRLCLVEANGFVWIPDENVEDLQNIFPFHPAPWIRKYVQEHLFLEQESLFFPWQDHDAVSLRFPCGMICLNQQEMDVVKYLESSRLVRDLRLQVEWTNAHLLILFLKEMDAFSHEVGSPTKDMPASTELDEYGLLGLPATATTKEIKTAYRRLARSLHPDAHPDADAETVRSLSERLARIRRAYVRLMDVVSRHG